MSGRSGRLVLAASLALAPGALLAQDHAVPRGGGGGGGGSDAGARHAGPSTSGSSPSSGSSSSSSSSNGGYSGQSTAERRHPRAGTGSGSGGYYPGYPIYPGYGWGGYYPGYGGYWWPYGYGWYGGYGYGGYPYGGGGGYYSSASSEGGSVRVLVDPAEARVYVDGYYAGVVDDFDGLFQRLHVAPGRHEITLKLEGYQSHRMRVFVGPDATLKIHHEMQRGNGETFEDLTGGAPPPEREASRERDQDRDRDSADVSREETAPAADEHGGGRLRLRLQPEDASVYVDGAFRGSGREAGSLLLAPGRHRIEIVRPGYRTAEQEIDVKPGETMPLSITLERPQL